MAMPLVQEGTSQLSRLSQDAALNSGTVSSIDIINKPSKSSHGRGLRRSQSFSCLSFNLNSTSTSPDTDDDDDCDSIYNAELVQPFEDLVPLESTVVPRPLADYYRPRMSIHHQFPGSHYRKPLTRLDPIVEQRSSSSLRKPRSVAHLRPSLERQSIIVRPQVSIHSVRMRDAVIKIGDVGVAGQHTKSFSLNDLDCFPRSDTKEAFHLRRGCFSSSSSEAPSGINDRPASPLRPIFDLPQRAPTPPGVPSFGTEEAQRCRLVSESPWSLVINHIRQWLSPAGRGENHLFTTDNVNESRVGIEAAANQTQPMDMLKRILGSSRRVQIPTRSAHPRAKLPTGVHFAQSIGTLAQAEDSTFVRGRWGNRVSAHGVGKRSLDHHPLARATALDSISTIMGESIEVYAKVDHPQCSRNDEDLYNTWLGELNSSEPSIRLLQSCHGAIFDTQDLVSNGTELSPDPVCSTSEYLPGTPMQNTDGPPSPEIRNRRMSMREPHQYGFPLVPSGGTSAQHQIEHTRCRECWNWCGRFYLIGNLSPSM